MITKEDILTGRVRLGSTLYYADVERAHVSTLTVVNLKFSSRGEYDTSLKHSDPEIGIAVLLSADEYARDDTFFYVSDDPHDEAGAFYAYPHEAYGSLLETLRERYSALKQQAGIAATAGIEDDLAAIASNPELLDDDRPPKTI